MTKTTCLLVSTLLLTACAQLSPRAEPAATAKPAAPAPAARAAQPAKAEQSVKTEVPVKAESAAQPAAQPGAQPAAHAGLTAAGTPELPDIPLSKGLLYEYLLTEIAYQRGYKQLAIESSADLANKTHDPRLARRAAQLAFESGDIGKTITALKLWQELEPTSTVPTRMLVSMLLRRGDLKDAQEEMVKVLKAEAANPGNSFLQLFQLLVSYPDKPAVLKLMRDLAQPYPRVAEAHWAVAQLARLAGDDVLALNEVRQARTLRPDWDVAVSLEAQLLQKKSPQEALDVLRNYLTTYPTAREIRLQYARALLEQKQYQLARDEFQRLSEENPDSPDLAFAIALISLQMNDLPGAEKQLKIALSKGKKDQDTVRYYLGQLSEAKGKDDEAIAYYREVKGGEYQFTAQVRVAYLLGKQGKLDEAREFLHQATASNNSERVQLILVEVQLLRDAKRLEDAYQVLQGGLKKLPNNPDLLYETAMVADKLGKPAEFEQLMRKLIQLQPDDAQAYNALGYSLLDRNERIPEAMTLVQKALELSPDDAAIMDSVGWGYYRSGKLDESVKMLRRALAGNPDPEIAAHLGEVLWVRGAKGDREEARKVWQEGLKIHPDNAVLQAVIKKFMP